MYTIELAELWPDVEKLMPGRGDNDRINNYRRLAVAKIYTKHPETLPENVRGVQEWEEWPGDHKNVDEWVEIQGDYPIDDWYGYGYRYGAFLVGRNTYRGRVSYHLWTVPCRMASKYRDHQRARVYRAEGHVALPKRDMFQTIEQAQSYIDSVVYSDLARSLWPGLGPVSVKAAHKAKRASCANGAGIQLTKWGMERYTALHELCHVIVHRVYWHSASTADYTGHGELYATVMLQLVRWEYGETTAELLEQSYRLERVKYRTDREILRTAAKPNKV